jgi:bacteriorhodopsin
MPTDLSVFQYQLTLSFLNLTTVLMAGAGLLLILLRPKVGPAYQAAVSLMIVVVLMAALYYLRIYNDWEAGYAFANGAYAPSGAPLNNAYRSADWIGTVPLILSAMVLVLDLGRIKSRSLVTRLAGSAVAMIATGFIGDQQGDLTLRALWGAIAMLPFFYIVFVLWGELSRVLKLETVAVQGLFNSLRWLLLVSWSVYPVVYALPLFGVNGANVTVAVQIGYSLADLSAKVAFGLLLYAIAVEKTNDYAQSSPRQAEASLKR